MVMSQQVFSSHKWCRPSALSHLQTHRQQTPALVDGDLGQELVLPSAPSGGGQGVSDTCRHSSQGTSCLATRIEGQKQTMQGIGEVLSGWVGEFSSDFL